MLTIFEKIVNKQIEVPIVYEDENVIAINDINPQAEIHILVLPKFKAVSSADFINMSSENVGKYMKSVISTTKHLNLTEKGFRLVTNSGEGSGQTVPYLHFHILSGKLSSQFGS